MATGWRFPIRYKILAVLSLVVVAAIALYLFLASRIFFEDKTLLVYELNESNVTTLAIDLETDLVRVFDKLRFMALMLQDGSSRAANFARYFSDEEDFVRVTVLEKTKTESTPRVLFSHSWAKYLKQYRKDSIFLDRVRARVPIPFEKVVKEKVWIRNSTLPEEDSPPLMTVARSISIQGPVERVIYADIRLDKLLAGYQRAGIAQTYAVDSEGHALAHIDQAKVLADVSLLEDPLVKFAKVSKVRTEVRRFTEENGKDTREFLGSFSQVGYGGVLVLSKTELGEAFAAARVLVRKSLIYASIVVTVAFLIALFFSHSLTVPIQRMLEATRRIAKGDFEKPILITTHDELAVLATSFNTMTVDLRTSRQQILEYSRDLEKKVEERTVKLEQQNVAIKEAQEALIHQTRLASVGEIAGRAAHEVLNPLTNVVARLEKMQTQGLKADFNDLKLFREIVEAWYKAFKVDGIDGLVKEISAPSSAVAGKTMLEEDLSNMVSIAADFGKRQIDHKNSIEFLLKETARISKIVNQMRQLTRVSGSRKMVSVHKVLEDALATMADLMKKHSIKTELVCCEGEFEIEADSDELLQVFSNLLRNSLQAIEEARRNSNPVGSPARVWIKTAKSGQTFTIRVCDNGPGIPKDSLEKVFESSFTTKDVGEGTGLGLAISRRFIRALGGDISVEKSVPGVETVFRIELQV